MARNNIPAEPTPKMIEAAKDRGFVNGSLKAQFDRWRDFHIGKGTMIADVEASFRTWLGNAVTYAQRDKAAGRHVAPEAKPRQLVGGSGPDRGHFVWSDTEVRATPDEIAAERARLAQQRGV